MDNNNCKTTKRGLRIKKMNNNNCTMEVLEVSDSMFDSNEISYLVSNLVEEKPKHRCALCCKDTNRLNQGFHSLENVNENFLICDSCFAQTPRILIPTVLLSYYSSLRAKAGIVGIN